MANPGLQLPVIASPTRVELGARCHRRHLLSDLLLLKSYDSPSAAFGTQIHEGIHAWWQTLEVEGEKSTVAYDAMMDAALSDWPDAATFKYHSEDLARTMLARYTTDGILSAAAPQSGWEILDMEKRFAARITPEGAEDRETDLFPIITFKIDRLLHHPQRDTLMIVDTKTSARMDDNWVKSMRRSLQQRLYAKLAGDHYGKPVEYVFIEGLAKKQTPGFVRYEQANVSWDQDYIDEALAVASDVMMADMSTLMHAYTSHNLEADASEELLDAALLEVAATEASFNPGDCRSYFIDCAFMEVCDSNPNERVALLNDPGRFWRGEPWQNEMIEQSPGTHKPTLTVEDGGAS